MVGEVQNNMEFINCEIIKKVTTTPQPHPNPSPNPENLSNNEAVCFY